MGFSRQEYWSGLPCPSPGDLPDPGIKAHVKQAKMILWPGRVLPKVQKPRLFGVQL